MHRSIAAVQATLLAVGLTLAAVGCSSAPGESPSVGDGGSAAPTDPAERLVESVLTESEMAKYDESQRIAVADRAVDYAEYEAAIGKAHQCMRDAGASVVTEGTHVVEGKTLINYSVEVPDSVDGLLAKTDACYEKYAALVDKFWQATGTEVLEFDRRRDEALKPAMQECLSRYDVDWAADETMDDLLVKAIDLLESTQADCIEEIGYPTWQG